MPKLLLFSEWFEGLSTDKKAKNNFFVLISAHFTTKTKP
jgi:hypothetical protein